MTMIEPTGRQLLVPLTGEVVNLDAATDTLAACVTQLREIEADLYRARGQVNAELVRRLDHENLRTAEVGEYKITVDAPGALDWNTKELEKVLFDFVDHDNLSAEAVDRIMPMKRSVSVRELKKLLPTLTDEQATRVDACATPSTRSRKVRIDTAG